jgi:acyl-coenzyme A thioesterase PaaI-like protein
MADEFTDEQRSELLRLIGALKTSIRSAVALDARGEDLRAFADRAEALASALDPASGRRPFSPYSRSHPTDLPFSPVTGAFNPVSPESTVELVDDGGAAPHGKRVVVRVRFSSVYEGPPGHVHGGCIAAMFDQALAFANIANGVGAMTGSLTVRYRRPTPIDTDLRFEAWTDRVEDPKVFTRGECRAGGELLTESEGLFVRMNAERARRAFGVR